jgi:hypothetical protein
MFTKTMGDSQLSRGDYSDDFHTFGLLWSPNYILVYVDMVLKVCPAPRDKFVYNR